MNDALDFELDFDSCRDFALESERPQDQVKWLERALKADPTQLEEVLRVARCLENLSARTTGQAYIADLVEKLDEEKRSNK